MPDREKVIKAIEDCVYHKNDCVDCDYDGCTFKYGDCRRDLLADALALLKEQQEQIDKLIEENASNAEMAEGLKELLKEQEAVEPFHRCIGKEYTLIEDSHFDYCPYCGKHITWEGR